MLKKLLILIAFLCPVITYAGDPLPEDPIDPKAMITFPGQVNQRQSNVEKTGKACAYSFATTKVNPCFGYIKSHK